MSVVALPERIAFEDTSVDSATFVRVTYDVVAIFTQTRGEVLHRLEDEAEKLPGGDFPEGDPREEEHSDALNDAMDGINAFSLITTPQAHAEYRQRYDALRNIGSAKDEADSLRACVRLAILRSGFYQNVLRDGLPLYKASKQGELSTEEQAATRLIEYLVVPLPLAQERVDAILPGQA
ncbi:hypothetical protein IE81DRAFT_325986 [Ceraceosorus guamensis]|uniref:Uncharacterized protein n=1 Tax=Ceraceosorus guamensis TaxID=1522189 RepID=A0A316VWY5_9BASI|nr:hypothetical protein IE81DRAFT_325986 [Ceraceosorus guamensis]PWN39975.1 hypothetical protein IE81DRAFT_325986 [Ceraceosorus guamensis]